MASAATQTAEIAKNGEAIVKKSVEEVKIIAATVSDSSKIISGLGI